MPRRTAKSKAKNKNIDVKSCDTKNTPKKPKNDTRKEKCIKKELVVESPKESIVEEVFHRKSERRRVARDIFLVFEEESSRRKTRSNRKQTKPKFGHLKVEDPIKPKGLLRDIKNEPKCYLSSSVLSVNATLPVDFPTKKKPTNVLSVKKEKCEKSEKIKTPKCKSINSGCSKKSNNVKSLQFSALESESCTLETDTTKFVARVNPIFLWVKEDNTRIVEVRCEDYDKRNRIRITKTSSGWRATPRSDPTTSRILKFNPTPLMKVKREGNFHETNHIISSKSENTSTMVCKNFSIPSVLSKCVSSELKSDKLNGIDTVCNPLAIQNIRCKTKQKKAKKPKKKSHSEKSVKKSKPITSADSKNFGSLETTLLIPPLKANSSEVHDLTVQLSATLDAVTNKERNSENRVCEKNVDKSFSVYTFKKNTEDLDNANSENSTFSTAIPSEAETTYQSEHQKEFSLHLCPKTGLFLPNNVPLPEYENESDENEPVDSRASKNCFLSSDKEFNSDIEKINAQCKIQMNEENTESLEAKTKNLKDLLDDADLLQNCDDNANSDADLIDTIVKSSCENNLIQANEVITKASIEQLHQKSLQVTNDMVAQLISDVSNPPKCLSFNEAGEIEGLNGELFQSNTYIEPFDKQPSVILVETQDLLHSTTSVVETSSLSHKPTCENNEPIVIDNMNNNNLPIINESEDSPKDLSYKKREEVCPPSESRSQCAVTSSSDVIKSPQKEESSSLATSSETLKNLILEQFLKLNVLTTHQQREPVAPATQRQSDISKSVYTSKSSEPTTFVETVVIEDDENGSDVEHEEPLKKRSRLNNHKLGTPNVNKLAMIDKDPDPLTQLRLLIRNTQWKVPDPILVPKDRLSAVLASPAREIPLLITTRPELRLPEAFAYPEIIQNPNILVISMAQLEAILKNELEVEKTTISKSMKPEKNQELSCDQIHVQLSNRIDNDLELQSPRHQHKHSSKQQKNIATLNNIQTTNNITAAQSSLSDSLSTTRQEYAKIPQNDSSPSEINSATMAVLNQMLWLPYFGQISQDIGKPLKNSTPSQEKCSNLVPFFNSQLNGLTNFEELLKNTTNNKISAKNMHNTGFQNIQQQFKTNEELSLFQKIVQHQMQSVLQLNQLKADTSQLIAPVVEENAVSSQENSKSKLDSVSNLNDQRKQKVLSNKQNYNTLCKNQTISCSNNISLPEKSYNLRSSVAGRHSMESKQYSNNNQRQISEKPRLTCKSLSNLLDPEHNMLPSSSSSIPLEKNLSSEYLKSVKEIKRNSVEYNFNDSNVEGTGQFLCNGSIVPPSPGSCNNMNVNIASSSELNRQKSAKIHENNHTNNDTPGLTADANIPLWHPLFGSNIKTAYSSPWQWTTVTATGE